MAESISSLLAEAGFSVRRIQPGRQVKVICPKCGGGSTREESFSLLVAADQSGATGNCKRGSCGWAWGKMLHSEAKKLSPAQPHTSGEYRKPPADKPAPDPDAKLYGFFRERGISDDTVDLFGVYLGQRNFRGDLGRQDCIVFPFVYRGETVNRKFRCLARKAFTQEADALPTLFNIDAVTSSDIVAICEGEADVMAMHEAGYVQTVSLKDGAPAVARPVDDPKAEIDRRYEAFTTHATFLSTVQKFILAGDMDAPGIALREEVARRLGRQRCWVVAWPEGCKDACDTLRAHGVERVRQCVESASPYPIEGVHEVTGAKLDAYLEMPPPRLMSTGIRTLDEVLKLPGEGRVIVILGIPNSGKSTLMMNLMVHLMDAEARRFLVYSPEMEPFEEFAVQAAQVLIRKPARRRADMPGLDIMTRAERQKAGDWFRPRMAFLSSDTEDKPPTLDWILERGADCVMRLGTTDLLIDPINELDQARGNMSETDYIGRMLQRSRSFGRRHGCNVWIVCDPSKMRAVKPGDPIPVPGPYDAAGSAHFGNKSDVGITAHTPDEITEVHIWKSRFRRWGRKNTKALMRLDQHTQRYVDPDRPDEFLPVLWGADA